LLTFKLTDIQMQKEDRELVEGILGADRKAINHFYVAYRDEFVTYFSRHSLASHIVIDIYQDAIIATYQNLRAGKIKLENSSLKTYLFGVGKNMLYNEIKKRDKNIELPRDDYTKIVIEEEELDERQIKLKQAMKQLGNSCQQLLTWYYFNGWNINDIVNLTEYKDANTVKSSKSRCMKKLKQLMGVYG